MLVLVMFSLRALASTSDTTEDTARNPHERKTTGERVSSVLSGIRKERIVVLFNDALNTFYLRLYGIGCAVKDHSDS